MKEAVVDVVGRRDLLQNALEDAMKNAALSRAIKAGRTGETVTREEVFRMLSRQSMKTFHISGFLRPVGMQRRSVGFTLLEILVVLAIIFALAALLFPILVRVRESARRATCSSNLKQLYAATQQYVQDNDGHYPRQSNWESAIDPYTKNPAVFSCPSQIQHGEHHGLISDYDFNAVRFNFVSESKVAGATDSLIKLPPFYILLEDTVGGENNAPGRSFEFAASCGITMHGHSGVGKGYSTAHSEAGNYLFADGHVKWLVPENAYEAECKAGGFQSGFK